MTNVVNITPVNILNVAGFNRVTLSGNLPLFSDNPNIAIQATITKQVSQPVAGEDTGVYNTTLTFKKSDFTNGLTDDTLKAAVLTRLNLTEDTSSATSTAQG